MPAAFDACVKNGGKVRTMSFKGGKYMRLCVIHGHSYPGEMKTKKGMDKSMKK